MQLFWLFSRFYAGTCSDTSFGKIYQGTMWRMRQPLSEQLPSFHWLPDPPSTLLLLSWPWEDQSMWTASMGSSTLPLLDGLSQWGAPAGSGEREESGVQGINSSPSLQGVPKLAVSLRESQQHSRLPSLVLGVFLPLVHIFANSSRLTLTSVHLAD